MTGEGTSTHYHGDAYTAWGDTATVFKTTMAGTLNGNVIAGYDRPARVTRGSRLG